MKNKLLIFPLLMLLTSACNSKPDDGADDSFSNRDLKLTSDRMTPEVLWSFGRLGNMAVSPDQTTIVYTVTYSNIDENRSYTDIYTVAVKGGDAFRVTRTSQNESQVGWRPDGLKITYLSKESGDLQLWEMNADGSGARQVSDVKGGISGYLYAPDMKHIAYSKSVKLDDTPNDIYPDLPKANARIENDLMYRHWDSWSDYTYSHLFVADYQPDGSFDTGVDIMSGERFHSPMKPFGGMEQVAWTNDGEQLAYTCKKLVGRAAAFSTNSDIYLYNLIAKTTTNLTQGMPGYDMNPVFSPDGSRMAFESMARDGYEADKNRLMILDLASGKITDMTTAFDHNVSHPVWDVSGNYIWFSSNVEATEQIYLLNLATGSIDKTTSGTHNMSVVHHTGDALIATRTSMSSPSEIYRIDLREGQSVNLSNINGSVLDQLTMGKVEKRWVTTTDNKQMLVWVIYPPHFDAHKKYPTLLYCQGGPQSDLNQFWSTRWNFQMMAANDYIVVAPNRRGLPGFGTEWNEQISGDYGGQNMQDYLTAIDALAKEPFVDEDRLGAVGASYGGFSVYWLAGNHQKRFKTFIAHCGIFNLDMMYTTTEEMFFVDWDLKGPYWDKPGKTYDYSPHRFVDKWDTPILIIHGGNDFRIPYTQGMAAYNAAKIRNIPARFLFFPEESHWVLTPQNGILWQREFFNWLDTWLK